MTEQMNEVQGRLKVSEEKCRVLMKIVQAIHRRNLLDYCSVNLNPPRPWVLRKILNAMVHMMGKPMVVWVDDEAGKRMAEASPKLMRFMVGKDVFLEKGVISTTVVHLSTPEILRRLSI